MKRGGGFGGEEKEQKKKRSELKLHFDDTDNTIENLSLLLSSDIKNKAMHALQVRQSLGAARPSQRPDSAVVVPRRVAAPRRAASVITAAYSPPSMIQGATALDIISSVSSVVPDTVLLGKTAASDAPTAATVSAAVLAGLAANPAAGVREFQVRKRLTISTSTFVIVVVAFEDSAARTLCSRVDFFSSGARFDTICAQEKGIDLEKGFAVPKRGVDDRHKSRPQTW